MHAQARRPALAPTAVTVLAVLVAALLLLLVELRTATRTAAPAGPGEVGTGVLLVSGGGLSPDTAEDVVEQLDPAGRSILFEDAGFATGEALALSVADEVEAQDWRAIVVQGGELDVDQPEGVVRIAVLHMIDRIRAATGAPASLTIVGPLPDGDAGEDLLRVRNEVAAASLEKGVQFIDPVAQGWQEGQADLAEELAAYVQQSWTVLSPR